MQDGVTLYAVGGKWYFPGVYGAKEAVQYVNKKRLDVVAILPGRVDVPVEQITAALDKVIFEYHSAL